MGVMVGARGISRLIGRVQSRRCKEGTRDDRRSWMSVMTLSAMQTWDVCHHPLMTRRFCLRMALFNVNWRRRERNEPSGNTSAPWRTRPSGQAIWRGVSVGFFPAVGLSQSALNMAASCARLSHGH